MINLRHRVFFDILRHDRAFEFFMNYLADAERTVELTEDIPLKEFFGEAHFADFDRHRADEFGHAVVIDQYLTQNGFKLYPMTENMQVIAQFKRFIFKLMFPQGYTLPLSDVELAVWGAYFYCAEKSALQSFTGLIKTWKGIDHPRAQELALLFQKIVVDEARHVRFAWNLTMQHSPSEAAARNLAATVWVAYQQMAQKTEALLIAKLKEIILAEETEWQTRVLWNSASAALNFKTKNANSKATQVITKSLGELCPNA
jgi:hypothetical protein